MHSRNKAKPTAGTPSFTIKLNKNLTKMALGSKIRAPFFPQKWWLLHMTVLFCERQILLPFRTSDFNVNFKHSDDSIIIVKIWIRMFLIHLLPLSLSEHVWMINFSSGRRNKCRLIISYFPQNQWNNTNHQLLNIHLPIVASNHLGFFRHAMKII